MLRGCVLIPSFGCTHSITCDEEDVAFDWGMPAQLGRVEHAASANSAKKHLLKHPSSQDLDSQAQLLAGVAQIVADVSPESTDGKVTTAGVVDAIMRFQGVLLSSRQDIGTCTERIHEKIAQLVANDATQLE
jgi:hypothetical protein